MKLIGERKLTKLARKNNGNAKLLKCIKSFKEEIRGCVWTNQQELGATTVIFDSVHPAGFYIADINIHRAMVAIAFVELKELEGNEEITEEQKKELGEVNIMWVGTHKEYELTFGNNKTTIKKWLRSHEYIP